MRCTLVIGILAGLLGAWVPLQAQTLPTKVTVTVPKVEVRSGPTDKYYVTGELHQGEAVTVVRQAKESGWVAPCPGRVLMGKKGAFCLRVLSEAAAVIVVAHGNCTFPVALTCCRVLLGSLIASEIVTPLRIAMTEPIPKSLLRSHSQAVWRAGRPRVASSPLPASMVTSDSCAARCPGFAPENFGVLPVTR